MKKIVKLLILPILVFALMPFLTACNLQEIQNEAWGDWVVTTASTCETDGIETRVSKNNSMLTETRTVIKYGHEWDEWEITTEPTCLVAGIETTICKTCGNHDMRSVPALGHEWDEWETITEPTCLIAGAKIRVCKNNHAHNETRNIETLGHDWSDWVMETAPTCTTSGIETRVCKNNNTHTDKRSVAMLGHDWNEWIITTAPTCSTTGVETRSCKNDNTYTETRSIAMLGHDWSDWVVIDGIETRICRNDSSHIEYYDFCHICNKCDCGVTHGTLTPDVFGEAKGYENYLDFTFEIPNEIIYDYSNETNETLFAEILSGEKRYQDYLGWFAYYPQYIFRFNQAHLNLAETIIQDGKLSQADKLQYGGLLLYDNDGIMRLFASSSTGINYRIYINEDLTVRNFTIWITLNTDDFHQIDYVFTPIKDSNDEIISYYLSYAHLAISGDNGIYLVSVFYELETKTLPVAYGGIYKTYFDYISYIKIVCTQQHNELYLFTESVGTWNLQQVWETYKEQCLTTPYDYEHYGRIVIVLV